MPDTEEVNVAPGAPSVVSLTPTAGGAIERQIGGVTESAGADSTADSAQDAAKRLVSDLDRVSLIQALIDTEAATAQVIDLTERLVDARRR